ncbi:uncharacterized protein LOC142333517 isoform X1 [Lycorma delicatula]|uniref:uncharacterized protein LOC142333517 isoform X1 n=1 Tax=Lycorma delicatula TaxID=130591 RepID=UPI003F5177ED
MKNITVINMLIIIYVMSFFILCAENVPRQRELFKYENYCQKEKYADLQTSCQESDEIDNSYVDYIKEIYEEMEPGCFSSLSEDTDLEQLQKHKYYENNLIRLRIYKDGTKRRKQILPSLLKLLHLIPDKILIKKGTINTEKKSLISGIDITKTIPHETPSDLTEDMEQLGDVEFVTMDSNVVYAYSNSGGVLTVKKFLVSDEEKEEEIIDKTLIPCTLRLDTNEGINGFAENLSSIFDKKSKSKFQSIVFKKHQFEMHFSYICKFKFKSSLQVFKYKKINQYKVLNFTVSGYQYYSSVLGNYFIGLTYCLKHQHHTDLYLRKYFLYEFTTEKSILMPKVLNAVDK